MADVPIIGWKQPTVRSYFRIHPPSGSICMQQYASAPMDASTAAARRDLYIATVGAGASLTGLTFVAGPPILKMRSLRVLACPPGSTRFRKCVIRL